MNINMATTLIYHADLLNLDPWGIQGSFIINVHCVSHKLACFMQPPESMSNSATQRDCSITKDERVFDDGCVLCGQNVEGHVHGTDKLVWSDSTCRDYKI